MFFSIIIPCYNSQLFVQRLFTTLLQQTFKDFEVIFVDDCSTDKTFDLLSTSKETFANITILKSSKNSGPGVTKDMGVRKAKGNYILFMDSDDWFEVDALSQLYNHLEKENSDIVFFDAYRAYDTKKKVLIRNSDSLLHCQKKSEYIALSKGCLPYICFKANIWQGIDFPAIYNAEDIAVIPILISKAQKISVLSQPLYNYYYRANSLSNTPNAKIYQSFLKSYEYTCSKMPIGFEQELEFHGIKTVLYGAVLNALKAGITKSQFLEIVHQFEVKHSNWILNQYLKSLPKFKQFFLKRVYAKQYWLLFMYVRLHRLALEYLKL